MLKKVNPKGNMYQFITHCWNPVKGRCLHNCVYCYVKRFPVGDLRLDEKELTVFHGENNFIFVCSGTDLFAKSVPYEWIMRVLEVCQKYPSNKYLFQSKNPARFFEFISYLPSKVVLGTTIETNRYYPVSNAPRTEMRMKAMEKISKPKMITIEPIMDFDIDILVDWMKRISPEWINIGADSSSRKELSEPSAEQINLFVNELRGAGLNVKLKTNLKRIIGVKS